MRKEEAMLPWTYPIRKLEELVKWQINRQQERKRERALRAWKAVTYREIYDFLCSYYELKGVPLLSYPSHHASELKVPVYVRDEWLRLDEASLELKLTHTTRTFEPKEHHRRFFALYEQIRKA